MDIILLQSSGGSHVGWFLGLGGGIIFISMLFYFLPFIISLFVKKTNRTAIFFLNLLLGWTFIGWVIALVWAVSSDKKADQIIINNQIPTPQPNPVTRTIPTLNTVNDTYTDHRKWMPKDTLSLSSPGNYTEHEEKIEKLKNLKGLLDAGILTQEEFNQQKSKILEA